MRMTTIEQALKFVRRYSVATRPTKYPQTGQTWFVRLRACAVRTANGRRLTTDFTMPCVMENGEGARDDRQRAASAATRRGEEGLANLLVRAFERKIGLPGHRGWFQCVELEEVYDPIRRQVVHLNRRGIEGKPERSAS